MTRHAYLDESGTMDSQSVMSVALIVVEGANSAQKLHDHVMIALNPKYMELLKQLKKDRKSTVPRLHYADMSLHQKRIVATRLAQASVKVFTAHHHHVGNKNHDERFGLYTELTKICVRAALNQDKCFWQTKSKQVH